MNSDQPDPLTEKPVPEWAMKAAKGVRRGK